MTIKPLTKSTAETVDPLLGPYAIIYLLENILRSNNIITSIIQLKNSHPPPPLHPRTPFGQLVDWVVFIQLFWLTMETYDSAPSSRGANNGSGIFFIFLWNGWNDVATMILVK